MAIITVARGCMCGGVLFAETLAGRLDYPTLSRETLVERAERSGVSERTLLSKMETGAPLTEELAAQKRVFMSAMQAALADACVVGNVVYHGHAGHLLLKGWPRVLKIGLMAPTEMRIEAVMKWHRLTYAGAKAFVQCADQRRSRWIRFMYAVDWRNPFNYDVLFNLTDMSVESAATIASAAVSLPQYEITEGTKKKIEELAAAARAELALAVQALGSGTPPHAAAQQAGKGF